MKPVLLRLFAGCAGVVLFLGMASAQIHTETTTTGGGRTVSSKSYFMPGMFKFVQDDGSNSMRFDRDYWIGADSNKKSIGG